MRRATTPCLLALTCLLGLCPGLVRAGEQTAAPKSPAPVLTGKKSYSVLLVGNSYLKSTVQKKRTFLSDVLGKLSTGGKSAAGMTCAKKYASNTDLGHHWKAGRKLLAKHKYDGVVLQEHSQWLPKKYDETLKNARNFREAVGKKGGKVVLFMIWARKARPQDMKGIEEACSRLGRELKCVVAPIGLAWQLVLKEKPEIALHAKDGQHPALLGTYLNACVLYATLTGKSPVGLGNAGIEEATPEVRKYLQEAAWRTVQNYSSAGPANNPDTSDKPDKPDKPDRSDKSEGAEKSRKPAHESSGRNG